MKSNTTMAILIIVIVFILGLFGFIWCTDTLKDNAKKSTSKIIQTSDADIRKQAAEIAKERYNSTHSGWRWFTRNTWGRGEYNELLAEAILELAPEQEEAVKKNFLEKYGQVLIYVIIAVVIIIIMLIVCALNARSSTANRVPIPTTPPMPTVVTQVPPAVTDVRQFDVDYEQVLRKHTKRLGVSPEELLAEHNGNVREAAQDAMQRM